MENIFKTKEFRVSAVIFFYVLLLVLWQCIHSLEIWPNYILPSPSEVGSRILELGGDGTLTPSILATLRRMTLGFIFASTIGISIGLIMGGSQIIGLCLRSFFLGLQTLPTAAWVPLSLILFGLKDSGVYFVIIMSAMPAMAIATADGIRRIPPIYINAARIFGITPLSMPFRVIIPAAFPSIITGIKLAWTLGWHGAVSAELIKSSIGLGYLLHMGRELSDASQVIGIMIITILFGSIIDYFLFGYIEKRTLKRWGLQVA